MRKFFDTIFYNLYILYTKIIPDFEPLFTVYSLMGFLFSLPFTISLSIIILIYFNVDIGAGILFAISLIFIFFSYLYFAKSKRYLSIIKYKPVIRNRFFSKIITFLYVVVNLIIVFAGLGYFGYNIRQEKRDNGEIVKNLNISLRRGLIYEDYKETDSSLFPSPETIQKARDEGW